MCSFWKEYGYHFRRCTSSKRQNRRYRPDPLFEAFFQYRSCLVLCLCERFHSHAPSEWLKSFECQRVGQFGGQAFSCIQQRGQWDSCRADPWPWLWYPIDIHRKSQDNAQCSHLYSSSWHLLKIDNFNILHKVRPHISQIWQRKSVHFW